VVPGPNRGVPQRMPPPAPGGAGAKRGSPPGGGNQPSYQQVHPCVPPFRRQSQSAAFSARGACSPVLVPYLPSVLLPH